MTGSYSSSFSNSSSNYLIEFSYRIVTADKNPKTEIACATHTTIVTSLADKDFLFASKKHVAAEFHSSHPPTNIKLYYIYFIT